MSHILVIDDDTRIRELLKAFLEGKGYRVTLASNATEARATLQGIVFDLVILDVMMPGESGVDFAAAVRAKGIETPILMLSAKAETDDRVTGLAAGSDDYLVKPFDPRELMLRMESLLRRTAPRSEAPDEIRFANFTFNLQRGELRRDNELIHLTTREKEILRMLAQNHGKAMSRQDLAGSDDTARGVDVLINRLRQKIENDPSMPLHLQTVRGAGYTLYVDAA
jgi:two-component system, OmpR family, phosphate regulon response regulator OmpR